MRYAVRNDRLCNIDDTCPYRTDRLTEPVTRPARMTCVREEFDQLAALRGALCARKPRLSGLRGCLKPQRMFYSQRPCLCARARAQYGAPERQPSENQGAYVTRAPKELTKGLETAFHLKRIDSGIERNFVTPPLRLFHDIKKPRP